MQSLRGRRLCRIATCALATVATVLIGISPTAASGRSKAPLKAMLLGDVSAPATEAASWPQLHYGPSRTGYQPDETDIGTGNVGTLKEAWSYIGDTPPLIANGILYAVTNKLYAYDATGSGACAAPPKGCTPLWTAPAAYLDGMAVADGDVFVTDQEGVQAYDASGSRNCSGMPKVCSPIWSTSVNEATGQGFSPGQGSPVVANGTLYVPGYGDGIVPSGGGAYVAAFDPEGLNGCKFYKEFGTICVPMWTTIGLPASQGNSGSPAVANGVVYIANGSLFAFNASGCPAAPSGCSPMWTTARVSGETYSAPAVADGSVFVGAANGPLYAYDAAGVVGCNGSGEAKSCAPLWTAVTGGTGGSPAVANGIVYTVSAGGRLSAFDASGSDRNCTGSPPTRTCAPLWTALAGTGTGYVTFSSPAIANGVIYFSSTDGATYAYDAAGSIGCSASGGAKTCAALWSASTGFIGGGSPAVVNGALYINVDGDNEIYAYTLKGALKGLSCPDFTIIGARGSGQSDIAATNGLGPEVDMVALSLESDLRGQGATAQVLHVAYPAAAVTELAPTSRQLGLLATGQFDAFVSSYFATNDFLASIRVGVTSIRALVMSTVAACPSSLIVLVGYSQGAMVVHQVEDELASTDPPLLGHIAGTVLIADGDRDPRTAATDKLGSAPAGTGIETFVTPRGDIPLPSSTVDVCDRGDIVCDFDDVLAALKKGCLELGTVSVVDGLVCAALIVDEGITVHTSYTTGPLLGAAASRVATHALARWHSTG
ncbi:MAG TPA: PQQ-binding-like beta-propeller repeat protein [Acidimicrobiales bacterium]|nr:PQQ-binding-like beta-propeller repeat protein [Acidimicrobiales bacterium]